MSSSSFVLVCAVTIIIFHVQAVDRTTPIHDEYHQQTVFNPQSTDMMYQDQGYHAQEQAHMTYHTQANHPFYSQNQGLVYDQYGSPGYFEMHQTVFNPPNYEDIHDPYGYDDRYHVTDSDSRFQTGYNYDQRYRGQQAPAHMTYDTQANQQLNQEHYVNTLPYRHSVENHNSGTRMQHEQVPVLSQTDTFASNNYDQTVTHDRIRSALDRRTSTSTNRFPSDHTSLHTGQTNPNAGRISEPKRNYDAAMRNRHPDSYSTKNVYVKHIPNNWMLNGIQNVIDHLHEFGCDINDEQPITLAPNRKNGELAIMMIWFEDKEQASQFIECVNTIQVDLDVDKQKVFLSAGFTWRNPMVDERKYAKSFTGVYCDIDPKLTDCNKAQLMVSRAIVGCKIAKSMNEIEFEPPCFPSTRRINYKARSKKLRNQAVACLAKRDDICRAVGTW